MNNIDKNIPAFPTAPTDMKCGTFGMPLAAYAAIHLRVPESGIDWLDAMIEKSRADHFAGMALQGMLANGATCDDVKLAGYSFGVSDAMLAARKPAVAGPEWISWFGGKRPVAYGVIVSIKTRDGDIHVGEAGLFAWFYDSDSTSDIVAYRIGGKS